MPALAIILHPAGEPDLLTWTGRPSDNVVGRWGSNASCVAVSRNVEIAGITYSIAQIWNHDTADLRLVKLYGANLANFAEPYGQTDESGKEIVIGGYGVGNGAPLENGGTTYGYEWGDFASRALRFGTNRIENPVSDSNMPPYISDVVVADFDDLNRNSPTTYECIPAVHDSAGGWFIKDDGKWKLAALPSNNTLKTDTKTTPTTCSSNLGFASEATPLFPMPTSLTPFASVHTPNGLAILSPKSRPAT